MATKKPATTKKTAAPSTRTKKSTSASAPANKQVLEAAPRTAAWRGWVQKTGRFIARTSLPEIFLVATLSLSRYMQNSDFSYPSEVVLNIVLLGILATGVYYIYKLVLRNILAAHVASLLLMYGLYGFSYTFPRLHHWGDYLIPNSAGSFTHDMLQSLFLAIIFGATGFLIAKLFTIKQLKSVPALKFLVFVVCFIFAVQLGKVGLRMWEIRQDLTYTQPTSSLQKPTAKVANKPNVYYLLFDRYASQETLKNTYKFDNGPLMDTLKSQGFIVRDNAFANYPFTMQSVSSTLSVGYHTKVGAQFRDDAKGFQTAFPYRQILDDSPVTQAFQANGYQYNQVSSWWDFTRINPSANTNPSKSFRLRIFGKNFWLTDLQRDIVNKSILSQLLRKGITIHGTVLVKYELDRNPVQNFYSQMDALNNIASNSATQAKPQFTFAHILSPHDPYIFDAKGNDPTYDHNRTDKGADEYVKYTNQLTFLNTQLTKLVTTIRTKDPSAVIVLQADEGPYPKEFRGKLTPDHYYDPKDLSVQPQRQKFGTLAAYYLPGVDQQAAAQTVDAHVNAFRFVLNNYLGYNLPYLPDCQFTVGDKYNLYTYSLVSGKLKGTAEPQECVQYK